MVSLYYSVRPARSSVMMTQGPILAYCPACTFSASAPYLYHGSRYGHVGNFTCGRCGAQVSVTDRDCYPPVTYHARPASGQPGPAEGAKTETIRYEDLYRINEPDFRRLERWTGLTLLGDQGAGQQKSGKVEFGPLVAHLAGDVARRGLILQPAPLPLPFLTWVPEPFRTWLDLYAALERQCGD